MSSYGDLNNYWVSVTGRVWFRPADVLEELLEHSGYDDSRKQTARLYVDLEFRGSPVAVDVEQIKKRLDGVVAAMEGFYIVNAVTQEERDAVDFLLRSRILTHDDRYLHHVYSAELDRLRGPQPGAKP